MNHETENVKNSLLLKKIKLSVTNKTGGKDHTGVDTSLRDNDLDEIEGEQALFDAARSGDCEMVTKLLNLGVSVEAKNLNRKLYFSRKHYLIPIHIAVEKGHAECTQILIDHGANVNAEDEFHCTALHLASEAGNYDCLKILLKAKADSSVTACNMSFCRMKPRYIKGTTALHLAAQYNNVDCVKELIYYGADYNAVDENGHTSLYLAAKGGFNDCVLTHLKNACGRTILSLPCQKTLNTPLHWAVQHEMIDCVRELVKVGCDINQLNKNGCSPLILLFWENTTKEINFEILKCLVLNGSSIANITAALRFAVSGKFHPKAVSFLIAYGADITMKIISDIGVLSLLEYEMECGTSCKVLQYIVQCKTELPHLRSLHVLAVSDTQIEDCVEDTYDQFRCSNKAVWEDPVLPDNVEFQLAYKNKDLGIEMKDRKMELIQYVLMPGWSQSRYFRYHLQQPLLDLVYNRVVDELEQLYNAHGEIMRLTFVDEEEEEEYDDDDENKYNAIKFRLSKLKQLLWYEKMASDPPALQQCCRYTIRKCLGHSNLRVIKQLPLPDKLVSYLLFDCVE